MVVAHKKPRKKVKRVLRKAEITPHPAVEKLRERLSSPRLRASGTIITYLATASNFLTGLKSNQPPTDSDFRRYFIRRREQGVLESSLRKEFFHLKKLALANKWEWPFDRDDTPYDEEKRKLPAMSIADVEKLIMASGALQKAEKFYLAVATTWLVRREELARIKKIDFDSETFLIHVAKHGKNARHLIPDTLKPVFSSYRPKEHTPTALSMMFKRICAKAGVQLEPRQGWHGIRYTLNTILESLVPRRVLADFSHWKTISSGESSEERGFRGSDMIEHYRRPEILDGDPYYADKIVYSVHPFLHLWGKG